MISNQREIRLAILIFVIAALATDQHWVYVALLSTLCVPERLIDFIVDTCSSFFEPKSATNEDQELET
jgi:hypothetical protein